MRRLWSVGMRLGLWIALEVGVLTWVATHTSNDFMQKLKQPVYAIEILFFVAAAVISAALALRSAIPGRALRASEATLAAVLVIAGTLLVAAVKPMDATIPLGGFVRLGLPCAYGIGIFAALPLLLLWWMVRRGASMSGGLSGLLAGAGRVVLLVCDAAPRVPDRRAIAHSYMASLARARADDTLDSGRRAGGCDSARASGLVIPPLDRALYLGGRLRLMGWLLFPG